MSELDDEIDAILYGLPRAGGLASSLQQTFNAEDINAAQGEVQDRFTDPVLLQRQFNNLKNARKTSKSITKIATDIAARAEQSGNQSILEQTTDAIRSGAEKAAGAGLGVVSGVADAFQWPLHQVQKLVTGEEGDKAHRKIRGMMGETLTSGLEMAASPLGAAVNVPFGAIGAAGDLMSGKGAGTALDTFQRTITQDSGRAGLDFAMDIAMDPLTYVTFGAGAPESVIAKQMGSAAKLAGMSDDVARVVGTAAAEVFSGRAGAEGAAGTVSFLRRMEGLGVPMEAMERYMGPGLRYAGKSGLGVGIPFTDEGLELLRREQLRPLTDPVWRASKWVYNKLTNGGHYELPVNMGGVHATEAWNHQVIANHNAMVMRAGGQVASVGKDIAEIPEHLFTLDAAKKELLKKNPSKVFSDAEIEAYRTELRKTGLQGQLGKERITKVINDVFRPPYTPRQLKPGEELAGNVPAIFVDADTLQPIKHGSPNGVWFEIVPDNPPGLIRIEDLSPAEARYVQIYDEYLNQQRNRLAAAGVLGENEGAYNYLSGKYIPTIFEGPDTDILGRPVRQPGYNPTARRSGLGGRPKGEEPDVLFYNKEAVGAAHQIDRIGARISDLAAKANKALEAGRLDDLTPIVKLWKERPESFEQVYGPDIVKLFQQAVESTRDLKTVPQEARTMLALRAQELFTQAMYPAMKRETILLGNNKALHIWKDQDRIISGVIRARDSVKNPSIRAMLDDILKMAQMAQRRKAPVTGIENAIMGSMPEWEQLQQSFTDAVAVLPNRVRKKAGLSSGLPKDFVNIRKKLTQGWQKKTDPHDILVNYQVEVEKKIAAAELDQWIADKFHDQPGSITHKGQMTKLRGSDGVERHVPTEFYNALHRAADAQFQAFHRGIFDIVTDAFKQNALLGMPRFWTINVLSDALMMWLNGFKNPIKFQQAIDLWSGSDDEVLFRVANRNLTNAGQYGETVYTKGQLREWLRSRGVGQHYETHATSAEYGGTLVQGGSPRPRSSDLDIALKRAAGESGPGAVLSSRIAEGIRDPQAGLAMNMDVALDASSLGLRRVGKGVAEGWDRYAKTAFFLDRLQKGDSPIRALNQTFEVLYDYANQDSLLRKLRKVFPFATWQYKSLRAIPRTVARSPYAVSLPAKINAAFGAQPGDYQDEPPQYMQERGQLLRLNPNQRMAVAKWVNGMQAVRTKVLGGEVQPLDPGYGMVMPSRDPITEGSAPVVAALNGNMDPVKMMLHPLIRSLVEAMAEKDLFTKKDMAKPELLKMFNYGDPFAMAVERALGLQMGTLQAHEGQMAWASRNMPQFMVSPLAIWVANEVNAAAGGHSTMYGAYRPYAQDQGIRSQLQLGGMISGAQIGLTTPTDRFQNAAFGSEKKTLDRLQKSMKDAEQAAMEARLRGQ